VNLPWLRIRPKSVATLGMPRNVMRFVLRCVPIPARAVIL